jgi:hypothetical protein
MSFVYGSGPSAPPAETSPWVGTKHEWVGHDGSRWELSNWRSGVYITQDGVEGLHLPGETAWVQPQSPVAHGQVYTGGSIDARPVFWQLHLYADGGSDEFRKLDSDFWQTLFPGRYGAWRVTTSAGTRELTCRADDNSGHQYPRDPHMFGWAKYGASLVADDPFWRGVEPVTRKFSSAIPQNFHGGGPISGPSTGGPPFVISEGNTLAGAEIDNPGDIEAWPVWRVSALTQLSDIVLGVGGRELVYPGPVPAGSVLTIDTDPLDQQAFLDGVNVTENITGWGFAPIPNGGRAPLSLSMDGSGTVQASIHPRWYRAW